MSKHETFHLGIKALIRDQNGRLLLLKKSQKITDKYKQQPYWDIPGGRVEKGYTIIKTLKREIFEEIGVDDLVINDLFYAVMSNIRIDSEGCGLILFIYNCSIPEGSKITLDEEHGEFGWFGQNEAAKLLGTKFPAEFSAKLQAGVLPRCLNQKKSGIN